MGSRRDQKECRIWVETLIVSIFFVALSALLIGASTCCAQDSASEPVLLGNKPLDGRPLSTLSTNPPQEKSTRNVELPETESAPVSLANRLIKHLDAVLDSRIESVQPLRCWAESTKQRIHGVVLFLGQKNSKDAEVQQSLLERSAIQLAEIRKTWKPQPITQDDEPTKKEDYVPTVVALEEIQLELERWALLCRQSIIAMGGETYPLAKLFGKSVTDLQQLQERTQVAQDFFLGEKRTLAKGLFVGALWSEHLEAGKFLGDLDACQKMIGQPNRRVAALVSTIPISSLVSFSDRANAILAKLDDSVLKDEQKKFLGVPAIEAWKEELRLWTSDTVSPLELLSAVDAYETTAGTSDMARLSQLTARLLVSRSIAFRKLGLLTTELYGGPNAKVYISKDFLNRLLPVSEPEEASFREVIQGQPVSGKRRVEKEVELNLIPASDRLLLSLDVKGTVQTSSRANAFATTLFNNGHADYSARKRIELTEDGFRLLPSQVVVKNNRVLLKNIRTDFDGVPVLSGLFREIVLGQYESRQGGARAETSRKIAQQAKNRIDLETAERFDEINDQFRGGLLDTLKQLGLSIETQNAKTENDWLLGSWRLVGNDVLSGSTPAPTTQSGSFADLKIHESAINALIGKLDIGGRQMSVGEFRKEIATKFLKPEFVVDEIDEDNDDVQIAFAVENPVVVRFADGRIEITVSIESLKIQRQTFRDFKGIVYYLPGETPDGKLLLQRDGIVSLVNVKAQLRSQIVLRAVFGKIFPVGRPLSLSPKVFDTDPRFADLKTGLCQIEKGWFSIALVAKE